VKKSDRRRTGLPLRTQWVIQDLRPIRDMAPALRDDVMRLRRIYAWQHLESPPGAHGPYRLAIRRVRNGQLVTNSALIGEEKYSLELHADTAPARLAPRFVYVFTIDSFGKSVLIFPRGGSVENRLPLASVGGEPLKASPSEIPLGVIEVGPPYGTDTYFLLWSDEELPNPWVLEWDGVRTRLPEPQSALEALLLSTGPTVRSASVVTSPSWSIERVVCESVPRRASHKAAARTNAP
jgi:hypothetical protein